MICNNNSPDGIDNGPRSGQKDGRDEQGKINDVSELGICNINNNSKKKKKRNL